MLNCLTLKLRKKELKFKVLAIFKKEFKYLFFVPAFYINLFFVYLCSIISWNNDFLVFSGSIKHILPVFVGCVGAALLSKEFKEKTYKLLFSVPVKTSSVVLGKYLALVCTMYLSYVILFIIKLMLFVFFGAYLVVAEMVRSLIAVFFIVALYSAVSIAFSSMTSNVGLACGIVVSGIFLSFLGSQFLSSYGFRFKWYLELYSLIFESFKPFGKLLYGIYSLESVGYFVVVILACLFLSKKYLEFKR